ncbi:MAG TPA: HAD hydrolase family protein [Planctomycetaceae bacterium]|nr:HAD hydrolase family protein [Planctomycetaceae bacterium]
MELPKIRGLALDVDGVLTDGTFWWGAGGEEFKRFSFVDIMGVSRARKAGIILALISGEDSPLVDRYAQKFEIIDCFKGCKDKAAALREFADRRKLPLAEICFMGDDINDLGAMAIAGFSAAPANAHRTAREQAKLVMRHDGGQGAVRELIDLILSRDDAPRSS